MTRSWAIVALFAIACDRPSPDPKAADTIASAARDSTVRRVVRFRRDAAAVQRVTGRLGPARAEREFDSVLAVRVLDARGDELPGAPVRWTLATVAAAARLLVINERTDSAGESRARFTPGRSASPQVVLAEVPGVGHIEFVGTIPVASVRVQLPREVWSGETVTASAVLSDSSGIPLSGGRITWATTDSSALALQRSDSQRIAVTGRIAGAADVWAWSSGVRGTARVQIRPVLNATAGTIEGRPVAASFEIESPGGIQGGLRGGVFHARVPWEPNAELVLRVSPDDTSTFHGARLRITDPRQLHELRVALIPRSWTIRDGSYAGQTIAIDALAALSPVNGRAPFWRYAPISGRGLKTVLGWHVAKLPIPIAFDRERSTSRIEAADSSAFWAIAHRMEADIGASFFRPAMMSDEGVVRVEVRPHTADGHTFVSWTQPGDANEGTVLFRTVDRMRDPHVVTHELLHLLGFGHSVSWPTVSVPASGREERLTPHDVAHVQLAIALRRSGQRIGFPRLFP